MRLSTNASKFLSATLIALISSSLLTATSFDVFQHFNTQAFAQSASPARRIEVSIVQGASTKTTDAFSPSPLVANVGDTIVWTNNDVALHTVTSGSNAIADGKFGFQPDGQTPILLPPGKTQQFQPTTSGDYPYFCSLHPAMTGILRVNTPLPLPSGKSLDVSIVPQSGQSGDASFTVSFFNLGTSTLHQHQDYDIAIIDNGNEIFRASKATNQPVLHNVEGTLTMPYKFSHNGVYTIRVELLGIGLPPVPIMPEKTDFNYFVSDVSPPPTTQPPAASSTITATLDKTAYSTGETAIIKGTVTNVDTSKSITLTVANPLGTIYKVDQFHPNSDGSFTYAFVLSADSGSSGKWSVSLAYDTAKTSASFSVASLPSPIPSAAVPSLTVYSTVNSAWITDHVQVWRGEVVRFQGYLKDITGAGIPNKVVNIKAKLQQGSVTAASLKTDYSGKFEVVWKANPAQTGNLNSPSFFATYDGVSSSYDGCTSAPKNNCVNVEILPWSAPANVTLGVTADKIIAGDKITFTGKVLDYDGSPIAYPQVHIRLDNDKEITSTIGRSDGTYSVDWYPTVASSTTPLVVYASYTKDATSSSRSEYTQFLVLPDKSSYDRYDLTICNLTPDRPFYLMPPDNVYYIKEARDGKAPYRLTGEISIVTENHSQQVLSGNTVSLSAAPKPGKLALNLLGDNNHGISGVAIGTPVGKVQLQNVAIPIPGLPVALDLRGSLITSYTESYSTNQALNLGTDNVIQWNDNWSAREFNIAIPNFDGTNIDMVDKPSYGLDGRLSGGIAGIPILDQIDIPLHDFSIAHIDCTPVTSRFTLSPTSLPPSSVMPISIGSSQITDISGSPIAGTIQAESQVVVNVAARNTKALPQNVNLIMQIERQDGITEFLTWQSGTVGASQSMTSGFGWTPSAPGKYTVKTFVWQSITNNPVPLSDPSTFSVTVAGRAPGTAIAAIQPAMQRSTSIPSTITIDGPGAAKCTDILSKAFTLLDGLKMNVSGVVMSDSDYVAHAANKITCNGPNDHPGLHAFVDPTDPDTIHMSYVSYTTTNYTQDNYEKDTAGILIHEARHAEQFDTWSPSVDSNTREWDATLLQAGVLKLLGWTNGENVEHTYETFLLNRYDIDYYHVVMPADMQTNLFGKVVEAQDRTRLA